MSDHTLLPLLKSQLNLLDHDFDDALLNHKLAAAEDWITNWIGQAIPADAPAVTEATLMLAAFWYEQREAASFATVTAPVPFGVHSLLRPYRMEVTGHVISE